MKYVLIVGLLLLTACTPAGVQCPSVKCPVCTCEDVVSSDDLLFVYVIDVGQGDSILVKQGETEMLIDCGKNAASQTIIDFLKLKQVGDIEYLLITHPDSDHLGGCDEVLEEFKVHSVITNGQPTDTAAYSDVMQLLDTEQHIIASKGNRWNIGSAEMRVIQANNGLEDTNENSIVTKLTYGTMDVLLTGDCDKTCEDMLLTKDVQSEILKVAHHGTKYGTQIDFLEKVLPQVAILSVGTNSYGHPAQETLDRLSQEGILTYRTDADHDITIRLDRDSYEVVV